MSQIVAISDIHADADKYKDVLEKLSKKIQFDETVFVQMGDFVDGAGQAKETVNLLQGFQKDLPHWVVLKGNHEDLMVHAAKGRTDRYDNAIPLWWTQGGWETYKSFVPETKRGKYDFPIAEAIMNGIGAETISWVDSLPIRYQSKRFHFVHAGFNPRHNMRQQTEMDMLWIRDEFIHDLTNFGKRVIFGHTCFPKPYEDTTKVGIDTMHHGHGKLTAAILDDETGAVVEYIQSYET